MIIAFCHHLHWNQYELLFSTLKSQVQCGVSKKLIPLMKLEGGIYGMTRERALQLYSSGFKTIHSIIKADYIQLVNIIKEGKSFAEEVDNYAEAEKVVSYIIKKAKDYLSGLSSIPQPPQVEQQQQQQENNNNNGIMINVIDNDEDSNTGSSSEDNTSDSDSDEVLSENEENDLKWGGEKENNKRNKRYKEEIVLKINPININHILNPNNFSTINTNNQVIKPTIIHTTDSPFWNEIKTKNEICLSCYYGKKKDKDESLLLISFDNSKLYALPSTILLEEKSKQILQEILSSTQILKVYFIFNYIF